MPQTTAQHRIYVDLDDVLSQTAVSFIELLAERFSRRVAFDDVHSFDLGVSFGLDTAELDAFFEAAHEPDVLLGIAPMPGAVAALEGWRARGHEVWVVTGRPPDTRDVSLAWLERHGFSFSSFRFVDKYSRYYEGAYGGPEGALHLDELPGMGFDFAVEDFPGTAGFLAERAGIPVALVDRPWNRDLSPLAASARRRITRCHGWDEVVAAVSPPVVD